MNAQTGEIPNSVLDDLCTVDNVLPVDYSIDGFMQRCSQESCAVNS